MAQIIKHRRGSITDVKGLTNRNAEIVIASGSINDLSGPFVLYGSPVLADEGVAGAFRATSKLYQGGAAPTISNATYGSILDGTPFHATSNNTLYILNNDGGGGNQALNLTGNIEGNTITNVSITNLTGVTADITSITGSLNGTADTASYVAYGNVDGAPTVGNGTITVEGGVGITGSESFTTNQAGNTTVTLNHEDTSSENSTSNVGNFVIQNVEIDSFGHITGLSSTEISTGTADTASYVDWGSVDNVPNFVYASGDTMTGDLNFTSAGVSASFFSGSFYGDGSNLTGLATELDISGDTGTATIDLLTQTFGIDGTTNEIETTVSTGGTVTIGLPDNVTIQTDLTIGNDVSIGNDLYVSGNFYVVGDSSQVHISSSVVEIDDNIIRVNAYSPFERYGGLEVIDSGSIGLSGSFIWDSENDVWLALNTAGQSSTFIGTTAGTLGSETTLTDNIIPVASGNSTIEDSLLGDNGTTLTYNTDKFTVASSDGATLIAGTVTLSAAGGADGGSNGSAIVFRNASNQLGYVSTTETTDVLDGILGYKSSDGALVFSTVIDGGTF